MVFQRLVATSENGRRTLSRKRPHMESTPGLEPMRQGHEPSRQLDAIYFLNNSSIMQ